MSLWSNIRKRLGGNDPVDDKFFNFTPRVMQTLALARKEADRLQHQFVAPEHLLVGLLGLGKGVAVNVLVRAGVNLELLRGEVQTLCPPKGAVPNPSTIPYTLETKRVIESAQREARALNHTYLGTEHILLGLLSLRAGAVPKVLATLSARPDEMRILILQELDPNFEP